MIMNALYFFLFLPKSCKMRGHHLQHKQARDFVIQRPNQLQSMHGTGFVRVLMFSYLRSVLAVFQGACRRLSIE